MIIYCIYIYLHIVEDLLRGSRESQQSGSFVQEPASPTSPAHLAVDCEFYKKKPGTGTGKIWKCIGVYRSLIKILSSSHSFVTHSMYVHL